MDVWFATLVTLATSLRSRKMSQLRQTQPSWPYKAHWLKQSARKSPTRELSCYYFKRTMLTYDSSIYDKDDSLLKIAKGTKRVIGKSNLLGKKNHRTGLFKNTTARSVSTSPSLGASRTPRQKPIMSISIPTDAKSQKEQAVKTPLFHLLAIRAVSKNWLVKETKCSSEECEAVLEKYGKPSRLDASKYDLSDRGFKELDIWSFPYKSDSERQGAIDHAISAFDRMRVPREEKIWQLLLPKAERNKGIFLSKLQLNNGSMQKVSTPLINVEQTDGARKEGSDDDQRGRLVPSDADSGARSEPIKRKKISEKEAQSKRLLSKNPKKATEAAKAKESKLAAKENKSSAKKETIKETSKSTAPSAAKVKSTEFVHESDEDVDMDDTLTIIDPDAKPKTKADSKQSQSTEKTKKTPAAVPKSKVSTSTMLQKSTSTRSIITAKKSTATTSSNSGSEQRITNGLPKPVPMQRNVSHSRNTSSPIKPSPLGSSPPTNASDLDNDGRPVHISSTHSSPFITSAPRVTEAAALKCVARKITHSGHDTTERQPTVERAKKRKVEDPDADSPAQSGGLVANGVQRPAKRHQASVPSPTLSDSSGSQSSPVLVEMVDLAKKFKTYYAQYEKLHRELSASPNPDNDQVERLLKMHNRLDVMKIDIKKGVAA